LINYNAMEKVITVIQQRRNWWLSHRLKYNKGLVIAGFTAFIAYCIVGELLIARHEEFEVTIFTTAFQGVGYLIMMCMANIFYSFGYVIDYFFNKENDEAFRYNLFNLGYWFSFCLPFLIPVILIFEFGIKYI
jgi:hypothetical protein